MLLAIQWMCFFFFRSCTDSFRVWYLYPYIPFWFIIKKVLTPLALALITLRNTTWNLSFVYLISIKYSNVKWIGELFVVFNQVVTKPLYWRLLRYISVQFPPTLSGRFCRMSIQFRTLLFILNQTHFHWFHREVSIILYISLVLPLFHEETLSGILL